MKHNTLLISLLVIILLFAYSCSNSEKNSFGKLSLNFSNNIKTDTFAYVNKAGNRFMISEIQYFISDVVLINSDNDSIFINKYEDIHYVDSDLPETFNYILPDSVKAGEYKLSFTFGINSKKNKSLHFRNPPESFMFWPQVLGGGYHYMKLNGKWFDNEKNEKVFNFHLGIGQIYNENKEIVSFEQNYFNVNFPEPIEIENGFISNVDILMQVEKWFETPNTWDFNKLGGKIMQNQEAIKMACDNGHDVFKITSITKTGF